MNEKKHIDNIIQRNIEDEMKTSYLRYSMSVIISRALPDVRDGLKPSQRRILFAMRQLSLNATSKHRKCAKIAGDTSGDYHPHGETVIYPTLVRMAQSWMMRYPLINGQGNFGSIDGDPPAAMRYTEARLTHASMALLEDLEKDTVDLSLNYDETKNEPVVFPSKFPNLVCNGSSGIAVGMATNIPPHNLQELINVILVLLQEEEETSIEDIMKIMPGPDFPTGGIICGYKGIHDAYHTGRGKLTVRGVISIEERENNKTRLTVTEIPYNVNKSRLIEHIAELVNNKVITSISDIRDDSDKDGLRIVIDLKRGEIPEVTINQLYKFSDLQVTFGCNMLALLKGMPSIMNIKQLIVPWIDHRIEVIKRRIHFELRKAEDRLHILKAFLKILDHLDQVIKLIRSSKDKVAAKNELIRLFDFSEKQTNAILEFKLYQLTGLEREKIVNEHNLLIEKINNFKEILKDKEKVKNIIREELEQIKKVDKNIGRRTKIIAAENEFHMEDLIPDTKVVISISNDDYIKRMPLAIFKEQRRGGQGVIGMDMKQTDSIKSLCVVSNHDHLLIFTNFGKCYWLKAWQISECNRRSKGRPLVNLVEGIQKDERIASILNLESLDSTACLLMVTLKGIVKKTEINAYSNPRRKGINAIKIDGNDELIQVRVVKENQQIMLFTRHGMAVRFDQTLARTIGRVSRGVKGVTLKTPDDRVVASEVVNGEEVVLVVCENGYGKRSKVKDFRQTARGGIGVRSILTSKRNGYVIGAVQINDDDSIMLMSSSGQILRINMKDVRVMGRSTQGVRLVALKPDDKLIGVQKISLE